jgi:hypothetical protein
VNGVAVDVAGTFAGAIELGGDSVSAGGGTRLFVAPLGPGGTPAWIQG